LGHVAGRDTLNGMKAQERRHLKQNEFAQTTARVVGAMQDNRDRVMIGAVAVVLILVVGGGYLYWRKHISDSASAMLGRAMALELAQVVPAPTLPGASQAPGTYPTETAKREAALKAYEEVAKAYPSTAAGLTARYQAAVTLLMLGRMAEADTAFQAIATDAGKSIYGPSARLGHAEALLQLGKYDEAIKALTDLSAERDGMLPVDGVLMELARAYLKAGRTQEARATLKRVVDEFSQSRPMRGSSWREWAKRVCTSAACRPVSPR
jgi:TolA-binding protein